MGKQEYINYLLDDSTSCEACEGFAGEQVNEDDTHAGHASFTVKMANLLNHHLSEKPGRTIEPLH